MRRLPRHFHLIRRRALTRLAAGVSLGLASFTLAMPAPAPQPESPWSFGLRFEGEFRYDDNILGLSDRERALVENVDPADPDRFLIETPDDYIFAPDLVLRARRSPGEGRETRIALTLRAYLYERNHVKDYEQYALSVSQELNRSRAHRSEISVGVSYLPSYFLRQLVDEDESVAQGQLVRNPARYSLERVYVEFDQEIVDRHVRANIGYAYERRDYNEHFEERDSHVNEAWVGIPIYPFGSVAFRIEPYYKFESRDAEGDLILTPAIDDDTDYDADHFGVIFRTLWGRDADHRNKIDLWIGKEKRDFKTPFTGDITRFGRKDDISLYRVSYERELGPAWAVRAYYRYRINDVSRPSPMGGRFITEFEKNIGAVALVYRFDNRP